MLFSAVAPSCTLALWIACTSLFLPPRPEPPKRQHSWQPNPRLPKERIDGAFQLADHRPDPPALDQPLPSARFPDTACPAHEFIVLLWTPHHHPAHTARSEYDRTDARRHIDKCLLAMTV
jgi:hypothetical protein